MNADVRLVRHARASGGWDDDPDPGLDDVGRRQAEALTDRLAAADPPSALFCSPLRRCRDTARPLAARLGMAPVVAPAVAELPSPEGVPMSARVGWLRQALAGSWSDLDARYAAYRQGVLDFVASAPDGAVVVSHFVAINAVIGACLGDDRLLLRSLDNTSVTVVEHGPAGFVLVSAGLEDAATQIR